MAYRRTESEAARRAGTRERIVRAGAEIVAREGFDRAQMAAVAARAGVATGTLYRYFPSKAALFAEIYRRIVGHEMDVLHAIAKEPGPPQTRLMALVRTWTARALERPIQSHAFLTEQRGEAELASERAAQARAFRNVFATTIRAGVESGDFPPQDVALSAVMITGAILDAVSRLDRAPADREAFVSEIVAFCLRAAGSRAEGAAALGRAARPARGPGAPQRASAYEAVTK